MEKEKSNEVISTKYYKVSEILSRKKYVQECIEYLNEKGYIIDYDTNIIFPDVLGIEDKIIELYKNIKQGEI